MTARQFGIWSGIAATTAAAISISEIQKMLRESTSIFSYDFKNKKNSELLRDGAILGLSLWAGKSLLRKYPLAKVSVIFAQAAWGVASGKNMSLQEGVPMKQKPNQKDNESVSKASRGAALRDQAIASEQAGEDVRAKTQGRDQVDHTVRHGWDTPPRTPKK